RAAGRRGPVLGSPTHHRHAQDQGALLDRQAAHRQAGRGVGLVNLSVPADELEDAIDEFVAPLTNKSPLAMEWCKLAVSRGLESDRETIALLEHFMVMSNHQTHDAREG